MLSNVVPRIVTRGPEGRGTGLPPGRPSRSRLAPFLTLSLLLLPTPGLLGETVVVPGGTASIRRLLDLGERRTERDFFPDVARAFLSGTNPSGSWDKSERRRAVDSFAQDLADWRDEQGCPSVLSTRPEAWKKTRRALGWLGYFVRGEGPGFEAEPRGDAESMRRQRFLDVLGQPTSEVLRRLAAGEDVPVGCGDGDVELPFGLAAWRETLGLDEKHLDPSNAFLYFVRHVDASRMMLALHAVDARTREELRSLEGPEGGYGGWKLLYDKALDGFALYPEALEIRGGRLLLPGGDAADPVWEEVVGEPPADRAKFAVRFFGSASGKAAYVAEALRALPQETARAFVLGRKAGGFDVVERFDRLYGAIGQVGRSYGNSQREPWDFVHLASFLESSAEGDIALPGGAGVCMEALDGTAFPSDETELAQLLTAAASRPESPEEVLAQILRREVDGVAGKVPASKPFVVVSALVKTRPVLADPGTVLLLFRGAARFLACYAPLEDLPLQDPKTVRRYLFTLDRLDTHGTDRDAELRVGLFQASVEVLAALFRSGSLSDESARELFLSLLDVPLFATPGTLPSAGIGDFDRWLHGGLLGALRDQETRFLGTGGAEALSWDPEDERPRPAPTPDGLLAAALTGWRSPVAISWKGGSYLYDPTADGVARRRAFAATQEHVPLGALANAAVEREAALASAREGNADAARAAVGRLLGNLAAIPPGREADERVLAIAAGGRFVLGSLQAATGENVLALLEASLGRLDALRAERTLDALAVSVYASSVLDPEDLPFTDALLVKRHSLSWGPRTGSVVPTPFEPTRLETPGEGAALRLAGAFAGLAGPLGLLHAEGLVYDARSSLANDVVRAGLVIPVALLTPGRLDDDALRFVGLACRATEQLPAALAGLPEDARLEAWNAIARDLVPAFRRNRLAEGGSAEAGEVLSPSELFRIGRRLALSGWGDASLPEVPAAREARAAWERLVSRLGESGARARLAEFGPRPFYWEGRSRLADVDLPSYERLSEYRAPHLFADRLNDLGVAVARAVADAGEPAPLVQLFLEPAIDDLLRRVRMAFAFDWQSLARAADALAAGERDERLSTALAEGRITRMESPKAR